jgi:hypothetical protein
LMSDMALSRFIVPGYFFYEGGNAFFEFIQLHDQEKAQPDSADYRTDEQYKQHCGYPSSQR